MLECHPFDPRLCLSAGYDGFTILWDIEKGTQLVRCESLLNSLINFFMSPISKIGSSHVSVLVVI